LAALFSELDVSGFDRSHLETKQMGILCRCRGRSLLGLREFVCDYILKNGLAQAQTLVMTGHLLRPDLFLAVPGWFGNFAVIVGCVVAYLSIPKKQWSDVLRLAVATACTTAFFAASMALCQPRYLALFSGLLHPHLHL
jgi:hypothetical protein